MEVCRDCVARMAKSTCPQCRQPLVVPHAPLPPIGDTEEVRALRLSLWSTEMRMLAKEGELETIKMMNLRLTCDYIEAKRKLSETKSALYAEIDRRERRSHQDAEIARVIQEYHLNVR